VGRKLGERKMKKIVLLPLDERPCNYDFALDMFNQGDIQLIRPELDILGNKKTSGHMGKIQKFLIESTKDADGLVISIDTLLYGGIVPSRLHHDPKEILTERLNILSMLKENNPKLVIYGFHLIMRSPQYSSSDEEPDYYADYGREIFLKGYLSHKQALGIATEAEIEQLNHLKYEQNGLEDFLNRRSLNTDMVIESLRLLKSEIIDFLIIPQDDAAEYGWTAKDQEKVRHVIEKEQLQLKAYMYPGADEVANTLVSKMSLHFSQKQPLIYIYYPSITSGMLVPLYEDRMLDVTVKYQIIGAGGLVATSIDEADLVLFVNAPSSDMKEAAYQEQGFRQYKIQRNLIEFVEKMAYVVNSLKKPVAVADIAYANGADKELVHMLEAKNLLMKIASYAGWNTSSNTLGTAIPHGISYWLNGKSDQLNSFLAKRYIEDFGYCTLVRRKVTDQTLKIYNYNYFYVEEQRGKIAQIVKSELEQVIEAHLPSLHGHVTIVDLYMPWRRMFEVGLSVSYQKNHD